MNRFRLPSLGLLCLLVTGCVEGEVTYTINPDGSAKIQFDVVTVKPPTPFDPGPKNADEPLDELLRKAIRQTLETPGVVAWKDVSARFQPDGKLKFAGTAYVKRLEDFETGAGSLPIFGPTFNAE